MVLILYVFQDEKQPQIDLLISSYYIELCGQPSIDCSRGIFVVRCSSAAKCNLTELDKMSSSLSIIGQVMEEEHCFYDVRIFQRPSNFILLLCRE